MFDRPRHRSVLAVLEALDADFLARGGFLFGGGTRIVLDLDEFRESDDVDFLSSSASGYAELRLAVTSRSHAVLFTQDGLSRLTFPREARVDQYGIRFPAVRGAETLKVELIREGRIELNPGTRPRWSPVECLAIEDCFAEKLLVNSDRWADRQVLSRDLLDLGAMRARWGPVPDEAWRKADLAYKSAPRTDLAKALTMFRADESYQRRCFEGLGVSDASPLLHGLGLLASDLS